MKLAQNIEESQQAELENGPAECGADDLSGVIGAVSEKPNGPRSTALCCALGGMRGHFTCKTRGEKFLC